MQILLANAKIMFDRSEAKALTVPRFQSVADMLAMEMASLDIDALAKELDCSRALAAENWRRYQDFFTAEKLPAIMAYNGQAYKHLKAKTLGDEALRFGQEHLWITCFLYGLLRPMDGIVPYRMERPSPQPSVPLASWRGGRGEAGEGAEWNAYNLHNQRKAALTQALIESVKADPSTGSGQVPTLVHLSTAEYEHLFDWKRVMQEVKVIHPLFYVRQKDGGLKMQAVWAKSCRGAMVRFILQNHVTDPEELKAFSYEGFEYNPNLGEELYPHFVRES